MTRKKFVKQLMAAGMARNDAADCATLAQDAGREYSKVLADLLNYHRHQFKNMTLAWIKMRYTIIHGRDTAPGRFFANIDEMHTLAGDLQIMSRADHDAMHGYVCGIDLAAGPDFTAYKPTIRLDAMVVNAGPVLPDLTKKPATELADEIMEKLQPRGGGGHD